MTSASLNEQEFASFIGPQGEARSQVADFYSFRSVFVTGASGFVGKILVEKLLRACKQLTRIYVLIRPKQGQNASQRLQDLLQSVVFDCVRRDNLLDKVVAIEGDISKPLLGISEQDLEELTANVSVIIHSAAQVGFEQPLKRAIESNLMGVHNIMKFALKVADLKALTYVSTAYANCTLSSDLDEHIYPVEANPEILLEMAACFDVEIMELIKTRLLGKHPNTYTYTKSLAEWLCGLYADRLPLVICRPSVVSATWREPIPGYVDNLNAANGIYQLIGTGLLRSLVGDNSSVLDHVPVDTVANCIIVCAWFAHLYHGSAKRAIHFEGEQCSAPLVSKLTQFRQRVRRVSLAKGISESFVSSLPVFHCSSGVERPIRMLEFTQLIVKYLNEYPNRQLFRAPSFSYTESASVQQCKSFVCHQVTACLLDLADKHLGEGKSNWTRKSRACKTLSRVITYFVSRHWNFNTENRLSLIDDFMSDEDRRTFNCDLRTIDWDQYARDFAIGIRRFMFKEPPEELAQARRHLKLIYWRNTAIQVSSVALLCLATYLVF